MSTKIYNAYVINKAANVPQWGRIKDIDKNLQSIMKRARHSLLRYARGRLSSEIIQLHDDAVLNRVKFDTCELDKSVDHLARRRLDRLQIKALNGKHASGLDLSLSATFFTNNDGSLAAVMFFGHDAWLNYIYDNAPKFGLRDYHYQNSTDKPDDVSTRDWGARCRFWDRILPSGVPWQDGYNYELFRPAYTFFADLAYDRDNWRRACPSFTKRIEIYAASRARHIFLSDLYPDTDYCKRMSEIISGRIGDKNIDDDPTYKQYLKSWRERYADVFGHTENVSFDDIQLPVSEVLPNQSGPVDPNDWVGAMVKVTLREDEVPIHAYIHTIEDSSRGMFFHLKSGRWEGTQAYAVGSEYVKWSGM